jgi:hypothetical protein
MCKFLRPDRVDIPSTHCNTTIKLSVVYPIIYILYRKLESTLPSFNNIYKSVTDYNYNIIILIIITVRYTNK